MLELIQKKTLNPDEILTFKLEFRASNVSESWENLQVSVVPLTTGKVKANTVHVPVNEGTCQWPEALVETVHISRSQGSREEYHVPALYKFVVSSDSSRQRILGETTIDLVEHIHSVGPVSLPIELQNCSDGSLLHVKIWRVIHKTSDSLDSLDVPSTPGATETRLYDSDRLDDEEFVSTCSSPSSYVRCEDRNCLQNSSKDHLVARVASPAESVLKQDASREDSDTVSHGIEIHSHKRRLVNSQRRNHLRKSSSYAQTAHDPEQIAAPNLEIVKWKQQLSNEIKKREEVEKSLSSLLLEHESVKQRETERSRLMVMPLAVSARQLQPETKVHDNNSVQLRAELAYLESVNSNLNFQLQKTQESNLELLSEIQELEKMLQEKESADRESQQPETDLHKLVETLQNEVKNIEQMKREVTEENLILTAKLNQADEQLKEKDLIIAELEHQRARSTEELTSKISFLEEELQQKIYALTSAEQRLKKFEMSPQTSYISRSLSRSSCRIGSKTSIPTSREAKEMIDLREKVKILEEELKKKAVELELSKHQFCEQYKHLSLRIEDLELANGKLVKVHSNKRLDHALKELTHLQNQNLILLRHENELSAMLASKECELQTLKKEMKKLEDSLSKCKAHAEDESLTHRIFTLENELAEVVETNNMYKLQLHSAYAKHEIVSAVALEKMESVEQVMEEMREMKKKKNEKVEEELREVKERYARVSTEFAEVVGERDELRNAMRRSGIINTSASRKWQWLSHRPNRSLTF